MMLALNTLTDDFWGSKDSLNTKDGVSKTPLHTQHQLPPRLALPAPISIFRE